MTTKEVKKEKKSEAKRTKAITFRCKFCDRYKRIDEMRVLTRYFPLLVACRDCEREMR